MNGSDLVPFDRLCLSATRLEARPLAAPPRRLAWCLAGNDSNTGIESSIETACDLSGEGCHGTAATTGRLAVSGRLEPLDWASATGST